MEGKIFKIRYGKINKLIPASTKFEELISLISKSFNKSSEEMKKYSLYYIDSDGDTVILENESDYNLLLESVKNQSSNTIKMVFEKKQEEEKKEEKTKEKPKKNKENENKTIHKNTQCVECGSYPIKGTRYKCSICPNYDVCENCEKKTDHEHSFLKLKKPESLNNLISLMSLLPFDYYYNNKNVDDDYNNNVYKSMPIQRNNKNNDNNNNDNDDYYGYHSGFYNNNNNNDNNNKKDKNVNQNEYHIPFHSNYDDYYYYYNNNNKENKNDKKKENDDDNNNNNYYYYSTFDNSNNNNNPGNFYAFFKKNKPESNEEKPSKSKVEKTPSNYNYNDYYFGYHPYNFNNYYDNDNYYNNNNYNDYYNEEHSNFNFSKKDFSYKLNEGNVLEIECDEKDEKKDVKLNINNDGKKSWNKNFVFANLKNYSAVNGENVTINKNVEPNENFEVNIQLNVKDLPKGEFISTWALQNENKENLGEPIPISIKKK